MSKENELKKRHKEAIRYRKMMGFLRDYDIEKKKVRMRFERKPYNVAVVR